MHISGSISLRRAASFLMTGVAFFFVGAACMPGGIVTRGGVSGEAAIYPMITRTNGAAYDILCIDRAEVKRRESLDEQERRSLGPPVQLTPSENYRGGCEVEGESSVFLLFNLWPATRPLDVEYAIAGAVQSLEGDTMIRIHAWHETHYYSILGRARVFKVRGDVIRFRNTESVRR